jgi:nucleoside-diphosphate-sugar epimerase
MRIAVLGGSGFIGTQIRITLENLNFEVACLHRSFHLGCTFGAGFDLFKPSKLLEFLEDFKPDVVIVAAWITDLSSYKNSPMNYEYSESIHKLAIRLISRRSIHLIVLGSCAEYGTNGGRCASNISTLNTTNLYSEAKSDCYRKLDKLFSNSDSKLNWLRVFQPYGVGQDSLRLIPSAINKFKENKQFILENPHSISDWITSRDIASAVAFCIQIPSQQVIDVGTGVPTTNLELLKLLCWKMGVCDELLITYDGVKSPALFLDIEHSVLHNAGWTHEDDLSSGLDWILESYK